MEWDLFISHASEDKENVARPLAHKLKIHGLKVWFDEDVILGGDPIRRSIDDGLTNSKYGLVIISPHFLRKKEWAHKELDGFFAREDGKRLILIPVRHELSQEQVVTFSPTLAGKLSISTVQGLDHVVEQILRVVERDGNIRKRPEVLLIHDSADDSEIAILASKLSETRFDKSDNLGVRPETHLRNIIDASLANVRAVAICVGPNWKQKWQQKELDQAIVRCVNEHVPIITVLLPGVTQIPET